MKETTTMKRALALTLAIALAAALPLYAWSEYTVSQAAISDSGETHSFGFNATEILIKNSGANEVWVAYYKVGETVAVPDVTADSTDGDRSIEGGDAFKFIYPEKDISRGGGIIGIGLKTSSGEATTVNIDAIRPGQ